MLLNHQRSRKNAIFLLIRLTLCDVTKGSQTHQTPEAALFFSLF